MKRVFAFCIGMALLLSACATGPKIDWQSRVGNYTYDQAVLELGPPDKQARLADGTQVAEWLTHRGRSTGGYASAPMRGGLVYYSDYPQPDYYLRLTFDPAGKLQTFTKYTK
jgi:hypothetical protein